MRKPKRRYRKLTQELILDRLRSGTLIVDFERMEVLTTVRHTYQGFIQVAPFALVMYPAGRNDEYLSVRLRWKGARGNVCLNRLAWIAHTMQPIPDGMEVDHIDDNPRNWHPTNLQLLTPEENKAKRDARYGTEDTTVTFT